MNLMQSIWLRLTIFVGLSILLGGLITWPFWVLVMRYVEPSIAQDPSVLGLNHAGYLVRHSLRRDPDGTIRIGHTDALQYYRAQNPGFRFAVFESDSGPSLAGSDPDLVDALRSKPTVYGYRSALRIYGDSRSEPQFWMNELRTDFGSFPVALYGYSFHFVDLVYVVLAQADDLGALSYLPEIILAVAASAIIIKLGLSPINSAVVDLENIGLDTLDRRLHVESFPTELVPFGSAINRTLSRLETAVAGQRRFLANAAHELRTPTAILLAHIEELPATTKGPDLRRDASRIATLVEQLLTSVAISSHQLSIDDRIDLSESVLSVVSDYMPLAVRLRRQIEVDCPASPVMIVGNQRAVESVVMNFIDNALNVEPEGGTVLVRIESDATIEVSDHGPGVEIEARAKVFEAFWRQGESHRKGTGLGLSIVKEIMDALGGRVWVEETPGGGATFKAAFTRAHGYSLDKNGR
jgi:signal transduction histidine kinase